MLTADFEISFSPSAELIGPVRRFIIDFYDRVLENQDLTSRMAVAAHELLENAVKYSMDEHSRISVAVSLEPSGKREVIIRTWNRSSEANVLIVRGLIADMSSASDASAHYHAMMIKAAQANDDSSGLGLGRIIAEGEMRLSCEVKDGHWLCIEARAPL